MVNMNYIQEYVILAETLNFRKTAEMSFITQPALSRHIAVLEEEIGAKLLERTTRRVQLTPVGQAVYKSFREILLSYRAVQAEAAVLSAGKTGALKISSPYYWTEDFTEPTINFFMQSHPGCDIQIFSCQPREGICDVQEGKCDIAVSSFFEDIDADIRRLTFAKEKLGVILRKDHPLASRTSLRLGELRGEQFLFLMGESNGCANYSAFIFDLLFKRDIYLPTVYYTQQVDTIGLSLQRYSGVCVAPYGLRHMDRSYLRMLPLEDKDCVLDMCIYYRMDNNNPLIPQFAKAAGESLASTSGCNPF